MRIGIVGVHDGHISGMVQSARQAVGSEIVGLVEADDVLYNRYTEEEVIPRYDSVQALLDGAKPDVVLEGITHAGKADLVEACAAAGPARQATVSDTRGLGAHTPGRRDQWHQAVYVVHFPQPSALHCAA